MAKGGGKGHRSAKSGKFVTKGYATSHPRTTLAETRGGRSTHDAHRSAISGKFVTKSAAKRSPSTTIKDS